MEKGILALFAQTEIFIFVFMEIVARIETIQRVIIKKASWVDKIIFIAQPDTRLDFNGKSC
jgi:hypothetical protein